MQAKTILEYISGCPKEVQKTLKILRRAIKQEAPGAKETLKWQMPTFVLGGNLVHFAANKNHIGFYPSPSPIIKFKKDLAKYKTSKGAIQFPINKPLPLPLPLIRKIVRFRVKEMSKIK